MPDIDDFIFDDLDYPILDDEVDEYFDSEIDELCCEGESSIKAMLDSEIETLQETGVLTEALELCDSNGNDTYLLEEDDDEDDDDGCDDDHYYIDDDSDNDDDDEDEEVTVAVATADPNPEAYIAHYELVKDEAEPTKDEEE